MRSAYNNQKNTLRNEEALAKTLQKSKQLKTDVCRMVYSLYHSAENLMYMQEPLGGCVGGGTKCKSNFEC